MKKVSDICAKDLRHGVAIEEENSEDDGSGGFLGGWSLVYDTMGMLDPQSGSEIASQETRKGVVSMDVYIRYPISKKIKAGMRVRSRGKIMNIRAVINLQELDQFLCLRCDEGAPT